MLERILNLMKEQGINKNKLAKLASLPATTIYSALSNEENLQKSKLETVKAIAYALSTTLDYIVTGKSEKQLLIPCTLIAVNDKGEQKQYKVNNDDLDLVLSLLQKLSIKEQ